MISVAHIEIGKYIFELRFCICPTHKRDNSCQFGFMVLNLLIRAKVDP